MARRCGDCNFQFFSDEAFTHHKTNRRCDIYKEIELPSKETQLEVLNNLRSKLELADEVHEAGTQNNTEKAQNETAENEPLPIDNGHQSTNNTDEPEPKDSEIQNEDQNDNPSNQDDQEQRLQIPTNRKNKINNIFWAWNFMTSKISGRVLQMFVNKTLTFSSF